MIGILFPRVPYHAESRTYPKTLSGFFEKPTVKTNTATDTATTLHDPLETIQTLKESYPNS